MMTSTPANTSAQVMADVVDDPPLYSNQKTVTSTLDKIHSISSLKGSITTVGLVNLMLILGFYMIPIEIMNLIDYPFRDMNATTISTADRSYRDSLYLGLVIAVAVTGFLAVVLSTIMTISLFKRKSSTEAKLDKTMSKWGTKGSKCVLVGMSMTMTFILLMTILFNAITIGSKHKTTDYIVGAQFLIGIVNMILYIILSGVIGVLVWIISITAKKDISTIPSDLERPAKTGGMQSANGYASTQLTAGGYGAGAASVGGY